MFAFIKSMFSESDGSISFARVASGSALAASIVWVGHVVFKTGAIPSLDGITAFITSLYAVNKIPTILKGGN